MTYTASKPFKTRGGAERWLARRTGQAAPVNPFTAAKAARPLFKDLTDAGLVEAYIGTKQLAHNGAAIQSPRLGRLLRDLDIIIAVARKRGVALPT